MEKNQHITIMAQNVTLSIDREKIWRVISNLITNAIKFTRKGGTIEVRLEKKNYGIVLSVKDNGIGIPENMKNELFQLFTDAKRTGTSGEQSFGMGLFISKQILTAHGAKIYFESDEGKGTTFYI